MSKDMGYGEWMPAGEQPAQEGQQWQWSAETQAWWKDGRVLTTRELNDLEATRTAANGLRAKAALADRAAKSLGIKGHVDKDWWRDYDAAQSLSGGGT